MKQQDNNSVNDCKHRYNNARFNNQSICFVNDMVRDTNILFFTEYGIYDRVQSDTYSHFRFTTKNLEIISDIDEHQYLSSSQSEADTGGGDLLRSHND